MPNITLKNPQAVEGLVKFTSVKMANNHFAKSYLYRGKLYYEGRALPIWMKFPKSKRPSASYLYHVKGKLVQSGPYSFGLKGKLERRKWRPSLLEMRIRCKSSVRGYLRRWYKNTQVYSLFASLITGEVEHPFLAATFAKVGLSHILAVSGFHFGWVALFFTLILTPFTFYERRAMILIVLISLYYLFVGPSPSIQRAWVAIVLVLIGQYLGYRSTPINTFGVALLVSLLTDPLCIRNVGFQLSYLATFGILLFYTPYNSYLKALFAYYRTPTAMRFSVAEKHIYLLTILFRKLFALSLAVYTTTLPLLLYAFGSFPLLTLLYNLFIPALLSLSVALLICGLALPWIFHPLNNFLTTLTLNTIIYSPKALHYNLTLSLPFSLAFLVTLTPLAFASYRLITKRSQ
ncbi:MAG: ComEC/Rec2 family competence protein [Simkaniaceae bacterium]|nr:ComEC/Rec2 family competence protein [Simkaniaceae bacterium]